MTVTALTTKHIEVTSTPDDPIYIVSNDMSLCQDIVIDVCDTASAILILDSCQCNVTISIEDRSSCELIVYNFDNNSSRSTDMAFKATLGESSQFKFLQASCGAGISKSDVQVVFTKPHALSELRAVSILDGNDSVFVKTHMTHLVGECQGRQIVKSILNGNSVSEFNGGVYVAKGADLTDSSQSNENLLLSDNARAISQPQLEIHADDVKAAHGANVGQLDERHVFYLMSRGIPKREAELFLLQGFILELIDTVSNDSVKAYLKNRLVVSGASS